MESNCCGASPLWETDLCSACKEHAEFYDEEVNELIEKLTHYYEVDLDNCKMTHEDWIKELANAMINPRCHDEFTKEYKEYLNER
jgi:hypothetical protein